MESDQESQAPAAPGPLPPPGAQPPPATDAGYLELLGVLRLRARGLAPWMLPRYFLFNVDVYDFHPQELLETYPAATAADGSSAIYFVNPVRAKTATDYRKRRSVPGGAWKSERAPVPLVSGAIEGTRQTFSFTVNGPKGKKCRPGFIMQEITLAGDEGALEGGDELAVSKIYRSPHGEKDADANSSNKRKIGAGTASYRAQQSVANSGKKRKIGARAASYRAPAQQAVAAASSSSNAVSIPAPALRLGSCNPAHQAASFFPAPALRLGSSSPAHQPPSPARPLRLGVSTSLAPPLGQSAVSTSSSPPLGQAAASLSSSQGRRFLVLEVANFPLMEGENFSKHIIYRASEVVGATRKTIDCDDLLVFQKKRLQTKADNYTGDISFTYEELNAATLGFPRDHFLGEGRFGKVYKGVLDGNEVAIKVLNPHGLQGNREFCTEAMVLSRMHHPNLVKLVGFCADDDQRLLVYEYMPLGSLETHIFDLSPDKKPLDWNTRMKILAGAAQGLKYLHVNCNPPMIHCDVKCANILLGEGYHPKLSDFGLAKLGPTGDNTHVSTRVMGTPGYCAPEYLEGGQLTIKSDVYSFGVVILEVITGRKALGQSRIRAERSLAEWATPLIRRKDFAMFADPALGNQYSMTSLFQVLSVARMCLNTSANLRPHMTDVAAALAHISMPAATNL